MSVKFEKITLTTAMETYMEDANKSTVSALDLILKYLEEEVDVTVVEFEQPQDMKLIPLKEKKGK